MSIDGVIVSDVPIGNGTKQGDARRRQPQISAVTQESPVNPSPTSTLTNREPSTFSRARRPRDLRIQGVGGVIVITTKRGRPSPAFNLPHGLGTSTLAYKNGSRRFKQSKRGCGVGTVGGAVLRSESRHRLRGRGLWQPPTTR